VGDPELAAALGLALTGRRLQLSSPQHLADDLRQAGFDGDALVRLRRERQAAGEPWPYPVPLHERRAIGFARFDAALADARSALGLSGLTDAVRAKRPLSAEERRLAADRPPHW